MQDIVLPGWAAIVFGVIILPWMVWLTLMVLSNDKAIAVNTNTDKHVADELQKIYDLIEKKGTETKEMFDKLERKFDMFVQMESRFFKQAFRSLKESDEP